MIEQDLKAGTGFASHTYTVQREYSGEVIKAVKIVNFFSEKTIQIKQVSFSDSKSEPRTVDLSVSGNYVLDGSGIDNSFSRGQGILSVKLPQYQGIIFPAPDGIGAKYSVTIVYNHELNDMNVYVFDNKYTDGKGAEAIGQHEVAPLGGFPSGVCGACLIMCNEDKVGGESYQSILREWGTNTNKMINASGFDPYKMYYYYRTDNYDVVEAGKPIPKEYIYKSKDNIQASYTLNTTSLISGKPIYLKGKIKNKVFYLDDSIYSQEIEKINDGFVYIFVGMASTGGETTSTFSLASEHPIYVYKDGHIMSYSEDGGGTMIQEPYFEFYTKNADKDIATKMLVIDKNKDGRDFYPIDLANYSINDYTYDIMLSRKNNEYQVKILDRRG